MSEFRDMVQAVARELRRGGALDEPLTRRDRFRLAATDLARSTLRMRGGATTSDTLREVEILAECLMADDPVARLAELRPAVNVSFKVPSASEVVSRRMSEIANRLQAGVLLTETEFHGTSAGPRAEPPRGLVERVRYLDEQGEVRHLEMIARALADNDIGPAQDESDAEGPDPDPDEVG